MRKRHPPPDPPAANPQPPPGPPTYDWLRLGRHRLRAADGAIIDLPVPITPAASVWVATIWPDARADGDWARALWQPDPTSRRGWRLPMQLAAGDVLEFGADTPERPVRWYAIMDSYEVDRWATVQGPYEHPARAFDESQRLLALERFVEPLSADPPTTPATADPVGRPRRDHRSRHPRRQHGGGGNPV